MKRYYFISDADQTALLSGSVYSREWHGIDLVSIGSGAGVGIHAVVTPDSKGVVPSTWVKMPHPLDTSTTIASLAGPIKAIAPNANLPGVLADLHLTASSTCFALTQALAAIHPEFDP